MPVLDTNFLIALKAQDPDAQALLERLSGEPLMVPSVVAAEYLVPFGKQVEAAYAELQAAFFLVQTTPEWVRLAATLRHGLRGKRRTFRPADFWIAVWAALHQTSVVTRNKADFADFGVPTQTW